MCSDTDFIYFKLKLRTPVQWVAFSASISTAIHKKQMIVSDQTIYPLWHMKDLPGELNEFEAANVPLADSKIL